MNSTTVGLSLEMSYPTFAWIILKFKIHDSFMDTGDEYIKQV